MTIVTFCPYCGTEGTACTFKSDLTPVATYRCQNPSCRCEYLLTKLPDCLPKEERPKTETKVKDFLDISDDNDTDDHARNCFPNGRD